MNSTLHITNQDDLKLYYASLPEMIFSITEYMGILEYRWTMHIPYFRGEAEEYFAPCLPSIWRGIDTQDYPENGWTEIEQGKVDAFRESVQCGKLNDPYIDNVNLPHNNSIEWLELAQHYGCKTRLLDVTQDPLVALFFAVSQSPEENGCIYLANKGAFNTLDPGEYETKLDKFFEIFRLREYTPADDTLFFYRPLAKNRRMIAQRGKFIWCRGIGNSLRANSTRIKVAADSKTKIMEALDRIGYNERALLPPR